MENWSGLWTVSYTHLIPTYNEESTIERLMETLEPVSYTHLDVYKRQIMACPNCYYFLKGRLDAEIISVYEKMAELKIGNIYQKDRIPMYYPCPDRKDRKFEYDMKPFLVGKVEDAFRDCLLYTSFVALPPIPIMKLRIPRSMASAIISPTP